MPVLKCACKEKWATFPGYPTHSISSKGRVRSKKTGLILKQHPNKYKKYLYVYLYNGNATIKGFRVHRIVLKAFKGEPRKGEVGRHLNGDIAHNCVCNLSWGSHLDNAADRRRHGTHLMVPRGDSHPFTKLKGPIKKKMLSLREAGFTQREIAKKLGIDQSTICRALNKNANARAELRL